MRKVRPLHTAAIDNLLFIRQTMERSAAFTAVPGWAGVAMGISALAAAWAASRTPDRELWLAIWLGEGMVAVLIGAFGVIEKAGRTRVSLRSAAARKFLLGFAPPLIAGALLTAALWRAGQQDLLPGVWIALYGAAIVSGGAFSVEIIPVMGSVFMTIGGLALFAPAAWGNAMLAAAFGVVHIAFGVLVARRYRG